MEIIIFILVGVFGATLPYYLHRKFNIEPVKASALPSLIVGLIFFFLPLYYLKVYIFTFLSYFSVPHLWGW